MIETLLLNLEI